MINIDNITVSYGYNKAVVTGVSFNIQPGEIVALLGNNGAGKTTIIKAICGLLHCTGNEITIDGVKTPQAYDKLAFITEEGSYLPYMTLKQYENYLKEFYKSFREDIWEDIIKNFQLENKKISKMSRGQRAKVEIAAGFAKGCKYILMDEPFLGKDVKSRKEFLRVMAKYLNEDQGVLITTHEVNDIEYFVDRAIIIEKGRIAEEFTMDELHIAGGSLEEKVVLY